MNRFAHIAELVFSWQKNQKVERTGPDAKNHWKITYNDGTEKWTDDRPGDGKPGPREERLHKRKQNRPSIKDAKAKLSSGYESFLSGKTDEAGLKQVVDDVIVKVGREVAREVISDFVRGKGDLEGKAKEAMAIIRARKKEKLRNKEGSMIARRSRVVVSDDYWQKKIMEDAATALIRSPSQPAIIYKQYLTYVDETSNKFHMFLVFEYMDADTGRTMYVGLNAHGPIGKRMTFFEIARGPSRGLVMSAVSSKEYAKRRKGYS
jgi:hypothetical protein